MRKAHWARGAWAVAAIMTTGIASAALPQQSASDPVGQTPAAARNQGAWDPQRGHATTGAMDLDHFLAKVVIKANKDEIATARLAEQRSTNAEVKKFAMQMAEDHTRLMNRLEQFRNAQRNERGNGMRRPGDNGNLNRGAANGGTFGQPRFGIQTVPSTVQGQPGATAQPNTVAQGETSDQRNAGNAAGHAGMAGHRNAAREFVAVMDEVANQTQKSLERELSQKEGVQFDRCYLGQQVMAHLWLSDALSIFERHASSELQPILQEGLQTAQQHLTHAKALLARIEQGQPKSTAARQSDSSNAR